MIKKIKTIIMAAILPLAVVAPLALAPVSVSAADIGECNNFSESLNQGINSATSGDTNCKDITNAGGSPSTLQDVAKKIVNFLSVVVGVVAVIMIIVGGFKYITSGGESSNVSGAKNTLIYAIVGLIIVALAQFIVRFVLTNVTTP